jgi:hypothetical protein
MNLSSKTGITAAILIGVVWLISLATSLAISAVIIGLAGDLIGLWDVVPWF